MRRRTEPVDAEAATGGQLGSPKGSIADDPRGEERRRVDIGKGGGNGVCELFVRDRKFRVTPVDVPPGEGRSFTQVLPPRRAVPARSTRSAEPGNASAISDPEPSARPGTDFVDYADDLMTRSNHRPSGDELALGEMEIGPTDPAGTDVNPDLSSCRDRHWTIKQTETMLIDRPGMIDGPCVHRPSPLPRASRDWTA